MAVKNLLLLIPQRYEFSSKSQRVGELSSIFNVVADTTKVRIFKQITTLGMLKVKVIMLLLIPQRYEFSSKSQLFMLLFLFLNVVADTTKVRIFKQITTARVYLMRVRLLLLIPQRYEFSSKSQRLCLETFQNLVVADTTKVRIFKQITTELHEVRVWAQLLLIPQRYEFSSKSQQAKARIRQLTGCC